MFLAYLRWHAGGIDDDVREVAGNLMEALEKCERPYTFDELVEINKTLSMEEWAKWLKEHK